MLEDLGKALIIYLSIMLLALQLHDIVLACPCPLLNLTLFTNKETLLTTFYWTSLDGAGIMFSVLNHTRTWICTVKQKEYKIYLESDQFILVLWTVWFTRNTFINTSSIMVGSVLSSIIQHLSNPVRKWTCHLSLCVGEESVLTVIYYSVAVSFLSVGCRVDFYFVTFFPSYP